MSELKDSPDRFFAPSATWRNQANSQGVIKLKSKTVKTQEALKKSSLATSKKALGFRLGAYIRLSPSDEIRDEGSLVSHPQRIKDFVKARNLQTPSWGTITEWYIDPDSSGKDMKRPAFIQMCRDIKEGKINAVIATELGRLNRNAKDFLQFWDFIKQRNVKMFVLKENFDTSTPAGEMMLIQMSAFAQFERESIVARIKDGARARAERGIGNGGPKPLGIDPDPAHPCRVLINEKEKPYVEMIFSKFLELGSIAKLRDHLNANGFHTKSCVSNNGKRRGGKKWTSSTLYGMITNLCYIGKREINKRNRTRDPESMKPEEHYKIVDAQWPALISEKIFSDAQDLLVTNVSEARPYVHRYRLKQLVSCGECGQFLVGKSSNGSGGMYFYYGHLRKQLIEGTRHLNRCGTENVRAVHLEEAVIERLVSLSQNRKLIESLARSAGDNTRKAEDENRSLLKAEVVRLKEQQSKIDGLFSSLAYAPTEVSKRMAYEKIEELSLNAKAIEANISSLKEREVDNVVDLDGVFRLLKTFNRGFQKLPAHIQRDFIRNVVSGIIITGPGQATIKYYKNAREEEIFPGDAQELLFSKNPDGCEPMTLERSRVRTVCGMVEHNGFEPLTFPMPWERSTN